MSDKLVAHSFGAQLAAVDEEDIPGREQTRTVVERLERNDDWLSAEGALARNILEDGTLLFYLKNTIKDPDGVEPDSDTVKMEVLQLEGHDGQVEFHEYRVRGDGTKIVDDYEVVEDGG